MRTRSLRPGGGGGRRRLRGVDPGLLAIWAGAAVALSAVAASVRDWFALTDELVYERLAINIARSGSPVPRIHGSYVRSLDQLYPLLVAPFFRHGLVPGDLMQAHVANAWLITSACIPAFLLTQRVTGRRWAAYVVALLSICLPWLMYAPFLLTENVAYPVFLWAVLAMQHATVAPSRRNDVLALLALALAFFARTEFVALWAVLPIALVAHQAPLVGGRMRGRVATAVRSTARAHPLVTIVYLLLAVTAVALVSAGFNAASFSNEAVPVHSGLIRPGLASSFLGQIAQLSFGVGILPVVVGLAWLLANLVRRSASVEVHAFACVGSTTVLMLTLAVARFDLELGKLAYDRYLFYLVPVLLLGFVCALLDARGPRWSLLVPMGLVAGGFAAQLQPSFTWTDPGRRVDSDTPVSIFYEPIANLWHSSTATQATLVLATIVLTVAFALTTVRFANRRRVAALWLTLLTATLVVETADVFIRLLQVNGNSDRPLTTSAGRDLDWIDRTLGTGPVATMVPYSVSSEFFVNLRYWRDVEFWNKSVERDAQYPYKGPYTYTGVWFQKLVLRIDRATGAFNTSPTPYVLQSVTESRFRVAGTVYVQTPETMLIAAPRPWRAAWMTFGLYDDGWTRPKAPARIRIFSTAGQKEALTLFLSLQIRAPNNIAHRPFTVTSNASRFHGEATNAGAAHVNALAVCVPARGFADVLLATPDTSDIPGDLSTLETSLSSRPGGVQLADISVSDDAGGPCQSAKQ